MKRLWIALAALLVSVAFAAPAFAQDEEEEPKKGEKGSEEGAANELNLVVGENKTIPATGVKNYSEGIKGIADVKLTTDNNRFVIA